MNPQTEQDKGLDQQKEPVIPPPPPKSRLPLLLTFIFLVVLILVGGYKLMSNSSTPPPQPTPTQTPIPSSDPTANWQTYSNTDYGFTFKYPPTWFFQENLNRNADQGVSWGFYIQNTEADPSYGDYIGNEILTLGILDTYSENKFDDTAELINGNPVIRQDVGDYIYVDIRGNKNMAHFAFFKEESKKVINQILSTFRFTTSSDNNEGRLSCEKKGGEWKIAGIGITERCFLKTKDGGKTCTDNNQCETICIAPDDIQEEEIATGICASQNLTLGCNSTLIDGKVQPKLCVD